MSYYTYIMANQPRGTSYVGVTSNLAKRVWQHKQKEGGGFTCKYDITMLVWVQAFRTSGDAITYEKRLKNWKREWKIELIESLNPEWNDLYSTFI